MDIATTLLEYGAKADAESKAGFTPLHLSSQEGHTDMSTLLIEHQADTNHKAKVLKSFLFFRFKHYM
jgi:ankyrin